MEKTELETVVKLLDKIITSERKEIKDAFRELMIIAALTEPNADTAGPLMDLLTRLTAVEVEVSAIKMNQSSSIFGTSPHPFGSNTWDTHTTGGPWNFGNFPNIASTGSGAFSGNNTGGGAFSEDGSIQGAIDMRDSWKSLADSGTLAGPDVSFQNPEFEKMWNSINIEEEEDK